MKKIGAFLLLFVLVVSAYFLLWSSVDADRTKLFAGIGIFISLCFLLSERITSIELPFLNLKAEIEKARVNIKEIEEIVNDLPPLIVPITELVQRVQPVQAAPQAQLEPGDDILVHCAV